MGICVTRAAPVKVSASGSPGRPTPRTNTSHLLASFDKKASVTPNPPGPSSPTENALSMGSDKPFADYDYHVWSDMQQHHQASPGGATPSSQHSSSIAALQRISMQRRSTAVDRPALLDDLKPARGGEQRRASRFSIGGRTRGLSNSFNDIYAQLLKISPRKTDEEKAAYLKRVFSIIDSNRSGSLSTVVLMKALNSDAHRGSVNIMIAAADHDRDGLLNEREFVSFFLRAEEGEDCLEADKDVAPLSPLNPSTGNDEAVEAAAAAVLVSSTGAAYDVAASRFSVRMRGVELTNLTGQSSRIKCIALSQDGAVYAVAHRHDNIAHVCTLDGREVRRLIGHHDSLLGIAFSPNRKHVITVARDKFLVSWDRTVGLECSFFEHPGIVTAVAVSHDGRFIYSGCQDNLIRKITASKSKIRAVLPEIPALTPGVVVSVGTQRSKNEVVVFSRSCDCCAYVCSAQNLALVVQLSGHTSLVWQTSFNADDSLALTCCEQKVIVWDGNSFVAIRVFHSTAFGVPQSPVEDTLWTTAVFGGKGFERVVFCFNSHCEMHMLNAEDEDARSLIGVKLRSSVYAASSFVGNTMVCGDDDGNVYRLRLT